MTRNGLGLAGVQLCGSLMWLAFERPGTREIHPQPLTAVLTCGVSNLSLVLSLLYNMLLIILCTFYAVSPLLCSSDYNATPIILFNFFLRTKQKE